MKKILALGLIQVTFCINFFEIANSTALFSDNDIAELILPEFNIFPSACNFIGKSGFYVHKGQMANRRVLVRVRGFVFTSPWRTIVWRTLESWVQDFHCKFLGTKYETSNYDQETIGQRCRPNFGSTSSSIIDHFNWGDLSNPSAISYRIIRCDREIILDFVASFQ